MKLLASLILKLNKQQEKTIADYKQDVLVKQGAEQFKALVRKGLNIPVAFL